MIRLILPLHLRRLARVEGEVTLTVLAPVTVSSVLDALEAGYPMLRGTIRDQRTGLRRPLVRFFACAEDLSHQPLDAELPAPVLAGREPFLVVGAMAGGCVPFTEPDEDGGRQPASRRRIAYGTGVGGPA